MKLWLDISDFSRRSGISSDSLLHFKKYKYLNVRTKTRDINGKVREFAVPSPQYKKLLKSIDAQFKRCQLPTYFYGSRKGCSAIDAAFVHVRSPYIYKLDLSNFFSNTKNQRIYNAISQLTDCMELSTILTELCTYNFRLPQGFPTSSTLSEIVLLPLGRRLHGICKKYNLKLSIYIDDITISGGNGLINAVPMILKIFDSLDFSINSKKSGVFNSTEGCIVTGVYIRYGIAKTTPELDSDLNKLIQLCEEQGTSMDAKTKRLIEGKLAWKIAIEKKTRKLSQTHQIQ